MTAPTRQRPTADSVESFAKYHDDHAAFGGVAWEFHARAASFLRTQAERIDALTAELAEARQRPSDVVEGIRRSELGKE